MIDPSAAESQSRVEQAHKGLPRWFEVPAAIVGIILTSPLLAIAAAGIALESRGGIVFRQVRVGLDGRPFTLYKFRTMAPSSGKPGVTSRTDARITRIGRVLRRRKIDELPTLWNVLRGEMALVGPRPEVPRYVDRHDQSWSEILSTRPGLTDPVTIYLRNEEDLLSSVPHDPENWYREYLLPYKVSNYREYLVRRTPWSDLGVICSTLLAVVLPARAPAPSISEIVRKTTRSLRELFKGKVASRAG